MATVSQDLGCGEVFVGIDVHLKSYSVCAFEEGRQLQKWTMPADAEGLARQLQKRFGGKMIHTSYEAGFSGFELHRNLSKAGIDNIVVHAASIAVNKRDRVKTDKRDAEKLAKHLAAGLLEGIRVPSPEEESRRQLTRMREQYLKARTRVMNQIRRRLVHFGHFTEYHGVLRRKAVEQWLEIAPETELSCCISAQLQHWEFLDKELRALEKRLKLQSEQCSYDKIYRSVPGLGLISARILANELGDLSQFKNEKALFCFVGLTPSEHSSGETVHRGHISRQGNPVVRRILVEAAWIAIRKDSSLKQYYSQLSIRSGKKKAAVAVARKLIGKIRAALKKGEEYREQVTTTSLAA
jgi:transposase